MKKLLSVSGNVILIFVAVMCALGAVISAFGFQLDGILTGFFWLAASICVAAAHQYRQGRGILYALIPTVLLLLWRLPHILAGARFVLSRITTYFNRWLYVPVLFSGEYQNPYVLTEFFAAAGVVLVFLLAFAICMRRNTLLTVLFTLPFAVLTFVIVFHRSQPMFLVGLLFVYISLMVSNGLSPDSFSKGRYEIFPAFLMAAVLLSAALLIAPPGSTVRGDFVRSIDSALRDTAERLGIVRIKTGVGWPIATDMAWGFNTARVGVSEAGTRVIHDVPVLEVVVDSPGIFYLRAYSMQYFDGRSWTRNSRDLAISQQDELIRNFGAFLANIYYENFPDSTASLVNMDIRVTNDRTPGVIYTPYFAVPFYANLIEYGFEFVYLRENLLRVYDRLSTGGVTDSDPRYLTLQGVTNLSHFVSLVESPYTYLQIHEDTARRLLQISARLGIFPENSREDIVNQVASFMTGFGRYTLSPFVIPPEEDFVLYFLEHSQQGFCIHYATAATMMLRALGVPARFVSGFVLNATSAHVGLYIDVTDRYAHAWVEVFFENVGWLPVEVTPPASGFGLGDGRPGSGMGDAFLSPGQFRDQAPLTPPILENWLDDWDALDVPDWGDGFADQMQAAAEDESGFQVTFTGFLIGLLIVAVLASPFIRRTLALQNREKRFTDSNLNESAIYAYKYIKKLSRIIRKDDIPQGVEDIALKARFSKSKVSEDERSSVVKFAGEYADKVLSYRTPLQQFWIKYIRGL